MTLTREIELPGVGEPDILRVRERDLPAPRPGQSLIRMEATGVSFAEQQMRLGKYYDQPPFPFVPGYDLVGTVEIGRHAGQRVAALTKTGAWADRVILDDGDLVPVPDTLSAEQAETVIVNGATAYRMLHRAAKAKAGDTVVVLGAAGGVGSTLVALARHKGIRVIGTASASQLDQVSAAGAEPIDHRREDVPARVRELAPGGVQAVFDHVGGPGITASWRMLAPGGTLVSYGTASTKNLPGDSRLPVLKLIARLVAWNVLPNGRQATFFNLWAGARRRDRYRTGLREDVTAVLDLLARGEIETHVAGRFGLSDAAEAMRFAEAGGHTGKVVLLADR